MLPGLDAAGERLFRDAADRTLLAVPLAAAQLSGYADPVQQLNYAAVPVELKGFEAEAKFPMWQSAIHSLDLELRADYTRARNLDTGAPLPRIPPLRFGGGLAYGRDRLNARLDVLRAQKQDKVPAGEFAIDAYTMLNAAFSYPLKSSGIDWEAFMRGTNLLNQDARAATSFLRDIAPLGKRAITVGVRGAF